MTANKFLKILQKLIKEGHGREQIYVNKATFNHVLESDGCVILDVENIELHCFPVFDADGGHEIDKRGEEKMEHSLVIVGSEEL